MVLEKVSFGNCLIFALALAEVTSWTVDLPEVRKFFFEKNEREKEYEDFKYKNDEIAKPVFYNNIEGNSKHNSKNYDKVYEKTEYAREYGYQSYMEKKVHDIVYNSSAYLEGLRRSLENYTQVLETCRMSSRNESSISNTTIWRFPVEPASLNSNNSTSIPTISTNGTAVNSTTLRDGGNSTAARCREATKNSEHVRRLSQLAAWATRELQDIAYARKYKKDDEDELMMQENELILKLAWFLDRLAHFTGFEPEPRNFLDNDGNRTTTTTTTPIPVSLVNPSEEAKRLMMECLQQNSSEPAVDRCRYEEPLPPIVQIMMEMNSNISGISAMPTSSSNRFEQVVPLPRDSQQTPISEQSMELLVASDNRRPTATYPQYADFPPFLTAVRNVQKRSIPSTQPVAFENAPKFKRIIEDDPAVHFLKYYAKHKVWEGSNLKSMNIRKNEEYEVKNSLVHQLQRRAIDNKKSTHLKLPENPFQDLSNYVKHKHGVNYIKDEAQAEKIKAALEKIENIKPEKSYKNALKKIAKLFRQKRYVKFEKDVDLPRDSVDPQKDISFYIKNKPGRNYNSNLVQAAQVRAGLQQVFNTGNIEVVRRFGANYNPLIPAPFFAGVLKSQADF